MTDESQQKEVAVVAQQATAMTAGGAFASIENFEAAQRMAGAFAKSNLVPATFKNNIGDCVIALEMSQRMGANPLAVMQNMYVVHGNPSWSSQFLISCINGCGRFSPLRYKLTGEEDTDERTCVACAKDESGELLEGPAVSIGTAKAEGWYQKKGSKWQTMPELMLRYRAAAFFQRLYAPELAMGMQTVEEVKDISSEVVVGNLKPSASDSTAVVPEVVQEPTGPSIDDGEAVTKNVTEDAPEVKEEPQEEPKQEQPEDPKQEEEKKPVGGPLASKKKGE